MSIVGFDDLPVARWVGPPLTTIRQPLVEMAVAAAELVLSMADGEPPARPRIELTTELIVRREHRPASLGVLTGRCVAGRKCRSPPGTSQPARMAHTAGITRSRFPWSESVGPCVMSITSSPPGTKRTSPVSWKTSP